jgi:hypothetical protein
MNQPKTKREAAIIINGAESEARAARAACDGYVRDFGHTSTSIDARERLRAANYNLGWLRALLPTLPE